MTDYEWLTEMGLCHRCRKEKSAPDKKYCFDCLEKIRDESAKRYDSEKAREYNQRRREIYREKKESGICVRCNKTATHGMYCYECSIKSKKHSREQSKKRRLERHERGIIPEKRKTNGLCLWCGEKAVNGKNVCERHMLIFSEAGKKSKENDKVVNELWRLKKSKNLSCI